jgi:hypothetical protein
VQHVCSAAVFVLSDASTVVAVTAVRLTQGIRPPQRFPECRRLSVRRTALPQPYSRSASSSALRNTDAGRRISAAPPAVSGCSKCVTRRGIRTQGWECLPRCRVLARCRPEGRAVGAPFRGDGFLHSDPDGRRFAPPTMGVGGATGRRCVQTREPRRRPPVAARRTPAHQPRAGRRPLDAPPVKLIGHSLVRIELAVSPGGSAVTAPSGTRVTDVTPAPNEALLPT